MEGSIAPPASDWRSQLQYEARQRIVSKILETLKKHLPISVHEGLSELKKIAVRFEEKIYAAATSQSDYLRRISMKMLSMETKTQSTAAINPSSTNLAVGNQNSADPASRGIQSHISNQGQSLGIQLVNHSSRRAAVLPPSLQNNTGAASQGSASLPPAVPSISGLGQSTISNVGQTSILQNMSGVSQNSVNTSSGQGAALKIYANTTRQMQGRQQQQSIISQQHQQQSQNPFIYQHQLQQHLLNQKISHPSLMQSHMQQQQQQQPLLQPNQLQSSQQPMMQMTSSLQSGQSTIQQTEPAAMQSASQSSLQQNLPNSIQQSLLSSVQKHQQPVGGQQQAHGTIHQQSSSLQQSTPIHQQSSLPLQQQQQMGQQSNISRQQTQLLGQQNSVPDMQQQPQRLPGQQNNLMSMQQAQQMLNQQTVSLHHQQQLGGQNNISGQQQQLLGSQSSALNMQPNQRSVHILQQTKTVAQQQTQQPSLTLLQSHGQQSQHQSSQQQLMSEIQSQPSQLHQQLVMQQQSNSLQSEMQQRLQASGSSLQSQNTIEQQKQSIQSQRAHSEVSSSMVMDSTAQTGHAGVVDMQEEIYQKIKSMKEKYFSELNEYYQRIALKFQQHEALTQPGKQSEQFEKLKSFKLTLERTVQILQISKANIQPGLKEKIPLLERQIASFLASHRNKKIVPSQSQGQQQFQQLGRHAESMAQQQLSQASQMQQHENPVNQGQQRNLQGSSTSMHSGPATSMRHGSVLSPAHSNLPTIQKNMANALQPASNLDSVQGSSFGSLQQGVLGSLQNAINSPLLQTSVNTLQLNSSSMQPGSNVQQHQNLKQQQHDHQQQHLMQTQQMKHQLQQCHMQQLIQQPQKQQTLQQQSPVPQQLHQQQKQQQTAQLPAHQMSQLHQMNDGNELKVRQGSGIKSGLYQQHYPAGQRLNYYNQQLKAGTFPVSSPQNLQISSPQNSQHSSPQIDQQSMLSSLPKAGTPLQSADSPFVVPSPSTPIAPSPIPGDPDKFSGISSLQNAVNIAHQKTVLAPNQAQSLAVNTPGISASPLLAEFTSSDANQANVSTASLGKLSATEQPLERLIKMVQSSSPVALSSSVSDIGSVVSMTDRIAGSAPGNGSRTAVGEDLVAMTQCRLQVRNLMSQDGSTTKKMKRHTSSMPLNVVSSTGSVNDSCKQSYDLDTTELESTATSSVKRHKGEVKHSLLEEIREINQHLINMVVNISEEGDDLIAAATGIGEGTVVKCSFSAVAFSPNLRSHFASAEMSPILPLRLLVPSNYPKCSPILLDSLPVELSKEFEDLSVKAQSRFSTTLRCLSQPMSLGEMVRTWDLCVRRVITEYAEQTGGGSFSSRYGAWENSVGA